jgi:signal recognition particle receptor subunit beta
MVFFNYATMQMAAKIVYYGPGLCGKTTNLHHIYSKTSPQSRGEMVSLETETDRTLFFDLLPIDVGVIGGFKTRLQLYTVPGQVFYNTTRKLVLKGVDGIVFVADSQTAALEANVESFGNLRENLEEIGLDIDEIPLVIQLNKRDLPNVAPVDTILDALDPERRHEYTESVASTGVGVFETLKLISKLTLRTLRQRMTGEQPVRTPARRGAEVAQFRVKDDSTPSPARTIAAQTPIPQTPAIGSVAPAASAGGTAAAASAVAPAIETLPADEVEEVSSADEVFADSSLARVADVDSRILSDAPVAAPPAEAPRPAETEPSPAPEPAAEPEIQFSETDKPSREPEVKHVKVRSSVDIMAELEALRKRATQGAPKPRKEMTGADITIAVPKLKRDLHRTVFLQASREVVPKTRRVKVTVSFEDDQGVLQTQEQSVDTADMTDVRSLTIDLKIGLE